MLFEEETQEALIQALNIYCMAGGDRINFRLKKNQIYMRFASDCDKKSCKKYLEQFKEQMREIFASRGFDTNHFPLSLKKSTLKSEHIYGKKTKSYIFTIPMTAWVIDNLLGIFIRSLLLLKIDAGKIPASLALTETHKEQYVYAFSFLQKCDNPDLEKEKITKKLLNKYGFELKINPVDVPDIGLKHYVFILKSGIEQAIQKAVIYFPQLLTKDQTSLLTLFNVFISDFKVKYKKEYGKEIEITNSIVNTKGEIGSVSFKCSSDNSSLEGGEVALKINNLYDNLPLVWAYDSMQVMINFDYQTINAIMEHVPCDPNYITKVLEEEKTQKEALEQAMKPAELTQGQHLTIPNTLTPSTSGQSSCSQQSHNTSESGIGSSGDLSTKSVSPSCTSYIARRNRSGSSKSDSSVKTVISKRPKHSASSSANLGTSLNPKSPGSSALVGQIPDNSSTPSTSLDRTVKPKSVNSDSHKQQSIQSGDIRSPSSSIDDVKSIDVERKSKCVIL